MKKTVTKPLKVLLFTTLVWTSTVSAGLPYDATANAHADIRAALSQATEEDKLVLLIFGANWCQDCRTLDEAFNDAPLHCFIEKNYVPVKINIGNWDKNQDITAEYGDAAANGIPSLVIVSPDNQILAATEAGELARARSLTITQLEAFLQALTESAKARQAS